MGSGVRKKIKIAEDDDLEDLLGPEPGALEKEESIDDILDDVIIDSKLPVEKGTIDRPRQSRGTYTNPRAVMGAFKTQKGQEIVGPIVRYWVVRDPKTKKLYYKEESGVVFLPEGWQEGDPIPELEDDILD